MTFTSPEFLVFLVVVYALYWRLPLRGQNLLILTASLLFYGWWDWRFLIMLLFIAGIDFIVAGQLMKTEQPGARKALLFLSLATNLGALGYFKYANFFVDSLNGAFHSIGLNAHVPALNVILPVGISFYTFQALSYTIDVYRRQIPAVQSVVEYFSFITFFPHMVAGPIQQAKHFLVQFHRERKFDWEQSAGGLRQMLWGFFKKMVVADRLAPLVTVAYSDPRHATGWQLLWATYLFAIQIYCDFSGYTDIAIGCACIFDLHMTRNFAYPYFASNIKEFWRRWHISLSNWFRDYLYIPLGGNRLGAQRAALNAFIVFVVSGFWHGANWTFVIWGALHGAYFYFYNWWFRNRPDFTEKPSLLPSPLRLLSIVVTFHLVCLAWVFFRADSVGSAVTILGKIGTIFAHRSAIDFPKAEFGVVAFLLAAEWLQQGRPYALSVEHWPVLGRWFAYYVLVAAILFGCQLQYSPFIYFQF